MSTPSSNMTNMAKNLATTKANNSTATPPVASMLNKPTQSTASKTIPTTSPGDMQSKMQTAAASANANSNDGNVTTPTPTQETCAKIIKESDNLISALESVGKIFGIPEENIICDDTLDDIKVQGETIMAPSIPVEGKGNSIMKSIAAVLDYISQRIDSKLNDYQNNHIERGSLIDHIENDSDPSKGRVVSRHITGTGDEIIVYDSGLVDMPNTDAARSLVNTLRANGTIPSPSALPTSTSVKYFTDAEDDITTDVDLNPVPAGTIGDTSTFGASDQTGLSNYGPSAAGAQLDNPNDSVNGIPESYIPGKEINVGMAIGESEEWLDLVSKYGNTKYLGYEMLTEQGFEDIKPIDFLLESGDTKKILPTDIKHMKFDNTHIMKAVKLFNEVRAEQKDARGKDVDIGKMVASPNWHKAIQELEKQFDCHIVIHYLKDDENKHVTDASTTTVANGHEYRQNVTVSKSKGFQLNGLPITIYLLNNILIENAPTDPSLFGQAVTAMLLHEIFHNIMMVFREYNTEFNAMLTTTVITASLTKNAKVRRKLITNFVNAVDAMNPPTEKFNIIQRRAYIKKLLVACSLKQSQDNMKLAQSLIETDDKNIDEYIKYAEDYQRRQEKAVKGHRLEIRSIIGMAAGISVAIGGFASATFPLLAMGILGFGGSYLTLKIGSQIKNQMRKDVAARERGDVKDLEEHWADQFAAMYNLPVSLFSVPFSHAVAANMTDDQIKRIHQIEMKWVTLMNDEHPPTTERLAAAVKYAQQTLDSGIKLNPDVKKYLEWIIANHSRILEVEDIDNIYSKSTFDPKTAEDIDLHIANLISNTNTEITEQSTN